MEQASQQRKNVGLSSFPLLKINRECRLFTSKIICGCKLYE